MKHRMPLYGDDHSILVTAEFWENGYLLKNGGSTVCRFEIDLITRDDIQLDQFLRELGSGIHQRLQKQYGITPTKEAADFLYWDESVDRADCRYENPEEFDDPEAQYASKSPGERAIHDWLLCWKLFHVCYKEYCDGYAETRDRDVPPVFPPRMDRHPIISCGSIDSRVLCDRDAKRLAHASQYWLDKENHGSMKLKELGFVNSTRIIFDPAMWHRADSLFGDTVSEYKLQGNAPVYRVGDRSVVHFVDTPIRILPPEKQDHASLHYLIPMVTAPILTIAVMAGIKMFGGNSAVPANAFSYILGAILAMAAIGLLGWGASRRGAAIRIRMQCRDYQKYIRQTIGEIRSRQKDNAEAMRSSYPPVLDPIFRLDLVHMANSVNSEIFGRTREEPAFLKARLGLSKPGTRLVPSSFRITGVPADTAFSGVRYENIHHTTMSPFTVLPPVGLLSKNRITSGKERYLVDLPEDIEKEYSFLSKAPVMLDIGKSRLVGILTDDEDVSIKPFLSNLVLDLCFHHSPDDLQIVFLFKDTGNEREKQNKIRYFKHLPHFRQLLPDQSAFAFGVKRANQTMDQIHELLRRRKASGGGTQPHILLITEEIDLLQYHTLSGFLPESSADTQDNPNGITFLVCAHYRRDLPQYCSQVVKVTHQKDWYLLPHRQLDDGTSDSLYAFQPDVLPYRQSDGPMVDEKDPYYRAFKTISALSCLKFGRSEQLPMTGVLELFTACGKLRGESFDFFPKDSLAERVRSRMQADELVRYRNLVRPNGQLRPLNSLAVPVGFGQQNVAVVDLHAAEMGSNLLVLSDNNAGRTEFLTTYLFSLSTHFMPEDVQVILADAYADGLSANARTRMFQGCLHTAFPGEDFVDVGADVIAFAVLGMVEKLVVERDILIDKRMGIRHQEHHALELYNRCIKDLDQHARQWHRYSGDAAEKWVKNNRGIHTHLPHVFLVMDNFDDLLDRMPVNQTNEFLERLEKIARVGSNYGLHIILSASSLKYVIPGRLLDRFQCRICLKHSNAGEADACVGITLPAERYYPCDGRAYLYSTANAHRMYFQTSYCGETPGRGFVPAASLTYVPPDGCYETLAGERIYSDYKWDDFQKKESDVNPKTDPFSPGTGKPHEDPKSAPFSPGTGKPYEHPEPPRSRDGMRDVPGVEEHFFSPEPDGPDVDPEPPRSRDEMRDVPGVDEFFFSPEPEGPDMDPEPPHSGDRMRDVPGVDEFFFIPEPEGPDMDPEPPRSRDEMRDVLGVDEPPFGYRCKESDFGLDWDEDPEQRDDKSETVPVKDERPQGKGLLSRFLRR